MPLTLALLATLLACQGPPDRALRWQESFELLAPTRSGGLVDARVSVGNRDLLRGQGHLRADYWVPKEAPVLYAQDFAPPEVALSATRDALRLGPDGLARGEDPAHPETWTFRARDEEARVLLHLSPLTGDRPDPTAWMEGGGQLTLSAPVAWGRVDGWVSSGGRGGLVEGWGVLLHRGGDGQPSAARTTILVLGRDLSIGLDQDGKGQLSWAIRRGQVVPVGAPTLELAEGRPVTLRFPGGPELELHRDRQVRGRTRPTEQLLGAERVLLSWTGLARERSVQRASARVRWDGETFEASAIILREPPGD